jgi:hypothetical protein
MGDLREFVAETLELNGAVVEQLAPDGLEVLAPEPVRKVMGWPELARLGFGGERPSGAIPIGLEGDWLDRFGTLLGDRGRWAERQLLPAARDGHSTPGDASLAGLASPGNPERLLERTLDLPNAVWRFQSVTAAWTRCLLLGFRYTALSDEKREGLIWLGLNLHTGAALDDMLPRLRSHLELEPDWIAPEATVRAAAGPGWSAEAVEARVRPLLEHRVRDELGSFLRAMRRRLERDRNRVHAYHDDLHGTALKRLSTLIGAKGEKAESDRKRETLRVAAIEREYHAKLDDLRRNYALRVTVEWVQSLDLFVPVQRFAVAIRRRKGERLIQLDWHPLVRLAEPPPCDWGLGLSRSRLVCDAKLHLTEPEGQAPCACCGKAWCRACHPDSCPHCQRPAGRGGAPH